MKALSIRQPWAWLIVNGFKPIENRTWATRYRGEFLIHASKGMARGEYEDVVDTLLTDPRLYDAARALPAFEALARGGIVGSAELVDCISSSESPWFFGSVGFVLANAKPLPFRPLKGALGFFEVAP